MPSLQILNVLLVMCCMLHLIAGKYERKRQSLCKDGSVVYDKCGQRCFCKEGKLTQCCRERKDFTSMTLQERRMYVNAMRKASTSKKYKKKYLAITYIHKKCFEEGIHKTRQFLPWHRWYLLQFENFMRTVDCRFTIPYWDWSYYRDDPFSRTFDSVWSSKDHGLGGNGFGKKDCVTSGPFSRDKWKVVTSDGDESCLQRKFNYTMSLPSLAFMVSTPEDFSYFEWFIRSEIHDYVHDMICGHMCSLRASSDPFFWMHHGFVDKLWDEWQKKSEQHKYAYYLVVPDDKPMVCNKLMPIQFMDSMDLPGGVSVCYVDTTHKNRRREIYSREEQMNDENLYRQYMNED